MLCAPRRSARLGISQPAAEHHRIRSLMLASLMFHPHDAQAMRHGCATSWLVSMIPNRARFFDLVASGRSVQMTAG
eukprot:Skav229956  [mRNA]  locus=scaffold2665:305112:306301:- [translate_table: standard]